MPKKSDKQFLIKRSAEKIAVVFGINNKERRFPYVDIAEGLVAHQPPDCNKKSRLLNITHKKSGMAVIQYVPHVRLPEVISILSGVSWNLSIFDIYRSDKHFKLTEEAILLSTRKRSERQEQRIAEDLGGKRQPASGARWGYRRDVITPLFLIEAKTTQADRYRLCGKDLKFLIKQAYQTGRIPAYIIELGGSPEVVVIPANDVAPEFLEGVTYVGIQPKANDAIVLHRELTNQLSANTYVGFDLGGSEYHIFSYEKFLQFSKDL